MDRVSPAHPLAAFAGGWAGVYALVATGFFMSIMFPTIFAPSPRGLGDLAIARAMLVPDACFVAALGFAGST